MTGKLSAVTMPDTLTTQRHWAPQIPHTGVVNLDQMEQTSCLSHRTDLSALYSLLPEKSHGSQIQNSF
jgi:hypothetical protein